ncbi:MAG: maturation protein [Sanya fiers-like virus 3]|nr:MAG: maturation protein [Sanya fiers-like virus 3]UUW21172.1 MAG: maturation protein [Sanya fiers-like virus 3]UYL94451.1 MAG: maturation protein [Sanya fiers-like virus 3]
MSVGATYLNWRQHMSYFVGPFVSDLRLVDSSGIYSIYKERYRSLQKPYTRPVPYRMIRGRAKTVASYPDVSFTVDGQFPNVPEIKDQVSQSPSQIGMGYVYAKAYDSYVRKVQSRAGVALSALEAKSSMDMIGKRVRQLGNVVKAVVTRNPRLFLEATSLIGTSKARRINRSFRKPTAKDPANLLLEVQFGWMPLVSDVESAIETLQKEFPPEFLKGSAHSTKMENWVEFGTQKTRTVVTHVTVGSRYRVKNPNLLLANELGFVNLASLAWQAAPFSFLVDWVLPIGRFLNSLSDLAGIEVIDGWWSYKTQVEYSEITFQYGGSLRRFGGGTGFQRQLGVSTPTFRDRMSLFPTASWYQARTLVALGIQNFQLFNPRK